MPLWPFASRGGALRRRDVNHAHHRHSPDPAGAPGHGSGTRVLLLALVLTMAFALVELVAGIFSGSLALIGDAGHMVTDSLALGFGALAAHLSRRPAGPRHTFGLQRAEIVGALVNAGFMLVVVAWIGYEAVLRLLSPVPVTGPVVLVVAAFGLALNLVVLRVLHAGERTLNTRGAALHVVGDLLGSVAALASGVIITFTGWMPVDPLLSLLISALILVSTVRLLREAVHVVMEGVPAHVNLREVGERLAALDGVLDVHDLHVWTLSTDRYAIAAHVRLRAMESWPQCLRTMQRLLHEEFGIDHVTLQPELPGEVGVVPVSDLQVPRRGAGPDA